MVEHAEEREKHNREVEKSKEREAEGERALIDRNELEMGMSGRITELQENQDRFLEEINRLKENEKEATNRENILASSIERSSEFENILEDIENKGEQSEKMVDDPLMGLEDLGGESGKNSENEEEG